MARRRTPVQEDTFVDLHANHPAWGHEYGTGAEGLRLHYVRQGTGAPVLLLHGWPGFWYDWRRVLPRLAATADAIAPDLRGFGHSDKPDRPPTEAYTPQALAGDLLALLDSLQIPQVVIAAHDIGATVAQALARAAPDRVCALVLFNPPYPGIGARRFEPPAQREFWYQHFHQLALVERLVGRDRDAVRTYLAHFYEHWIARHETVRPAEFEAVVDVYARPGTFAKSIAYYRARAGARQTEAATDPAALRIDQPTTVLWGEADPVIPVAWADRLGDYFAQVTLRVLPGIGHFVPFEAPEDAVEAIRAAAADSAPAR